METATIHEREYNKRHRIGNRLMSHIRLSTKSWRRRNTRHTHRTRLRDRRRRHRRARRRGRAERREGVERRRGRTRRDGERVVLPRLRSEQAFRGCAVPLAFAVLLERVLHGDGFVHEELAVHGLDGGVGRPEVGVGYEAVAFGLAGGGVAGNLWGRVRSTTCGPVDVNSFG